MSTLTRPLRQTPVPPPHDGLRTFWPDATRRRPGIVAAAAAAGVLAATVLPDRDLGLGTSLVFAAVVGTVFAAGTTRAAPAVAGLASTPSMPPSVALLPRRCREGRRVDHAALPPGRPRVDGGERHQGRLGPRPARDGRRRTRHPPRTALAPSHGDTEQQRAGMASRGPDSGRLGSPAARLRRPVRLCRRVVRLVGGRPHPDITWNDLPARASSPRSSTGMKAPASPSPRPLSTGCGCRTGHQPERVRVVGPGPGGGRGLPGLPRCAGDRHVRRARLLQQTTGLTYAEYVHEGFGQAHRRHDADAHRRGVGGAQGATRAPP